MTTPVVFVHGLRTSATMWRAQLEHLRQRGVPAQAIDLPGHGSRMRETFSLAEARRTIDAAVIEAAQAGPVLLVGHSMGGLLVLDRAGSGELPLAGVVAVSCTAQPRGLGLKVYQTAVHAIDSLPHRGMDLTRTVLGRTLPAQTQQDFGAGGYALDTQHVALAALADLDVLAATERIEVPLWFVNGQFDQLRVSENTFLRRAPHAWLTIIPNSHHLVTAMQPEAFNLVLDEALRRVG